MKQQAGSNPGLLLALSTRSRDLAKVYLVQLNHFNGRASLVTDKLPHNFEYLGLIALLFP